MNKKLTFAFLVAFVTAALSYGQSLKLNRIFVPYKIPKKGELAGYKTYEVKLLTKALVLTQSEVEEAKMMDQTTGVDINNAKKKGQLAQQYLAHIHKGFTLVDETKNPDIIFLLETSELNFADVNPLRLRWCCARAYAGRFTNERDERFPCSWSNRAKPARNTNKGRGN